MNEHPNQVRVRFAPSPTGFLHLGSARTALFNWLYARYTHGKLVLRVEDTDKVRSRKEYLDEILEDLRWMGIDWNEGPHYQSERTDLCQKWALKLLEEGLAYKEGEAIILKVSGGKKIVCQDIVHGPIEFNTDQIKDQVLMKSDGSAAYNFACVIDDSDMGITHIIRGDDHISNTPKQILIYQALGFELPIFAHMPLMMGKDGAKLSKRHGAVAVADYKKEGYLPEALANYLLLLGWSPGGEKEIITPREATKTFDIKDVGDVQARFDVDKLRWINGEYIRAKTPEEIFSLIKGDFKAAGFIDRDTDDLYALKIIELYKERVRVLRDFVDFATCYYRDDFEVDQKGFDKYISGDENQSILSTYHERLSALEAWTHEKTEEACRQLADEMDVKPARVIHPTRMAISGSTKGAGLFDMMVLLGKERCVERIGKVLEKKETT